MTALSGSLPVQTFQTYMSGVGCSGGYQGSTYFLKKDPLRLFTVTARLGRRILVECRRTLPIILCKRRKFFDLSRNQGENDYIAFAEYYNEPSGRSFGNCEIPFVTS